MKTLILLAFVIITNVFAGDTQETFCGDKSLSYCINHFDRQCEAKNYAACWFVGLLHYEQEQYSEAKKYLEMVCDKANSKDSYQIELINGRMGPKVPIILNMQLSCAMLGTFYNDGLGVRQSYEKAFQYLKKACELKSSNGCALLGIMYNFGEGVKQNLPKAKEFYGKACDLGNQKGCDYYKELKEKGY